MGTPVDVKIGPLTFSVKRVPDPRGKDDQKLYGDIQWEPSVITLDETLGPERSEVVLWHETLHGILEITGLDAMLGENEEAFVKVFAYQLVDVLRRNNTADWGKEDDQ